MQPVSSSWCCRRGISGFTLIELLVVISIIALLISMLLPALHAARNSARLIACGSNVKQMGVAGQMYVADDRTDALPWISIGSGTGGALQQRERAWWMLSLAPYYGHSAGGYSSHGTQSNAVDRHVPGLLCPVTGNWATTGQIADAAWSLHRGRSYSMNTVLAVGRPFSGQAHLRRTMTTLKAPHSQVMLFGESAWYGPDRWANFSWSATVEQSSNYNARRHPGGLINFGFADGHVDTMKLGQRRDVMMLDNAEFGWDLALPNNW